MGFMLVVAVTIIFPPILLFGFFVVNPREEIVVLCGGEHAQPVLQVQASQTSKRRLSADG